MTELLSNCYSLLISFHLVRSLVAEEVTLSVRGLGRDRGGVLHLCKGFAQREQVP